MYILVKTELCLPTLLTMGHHLAFFCPSLLLGGWGLRLASCPEHVDCFFSKVLSQ